MGYSQNDEARALWEKLQRGQLSPEEELTLLRWLNQYDSADPIGHTQPNDEAFERATASVRERLNAIWATPEPSLASKIVPLRVSRRFVGIAAACLLLVAGGLFMLNRSNVSGPDTFGNVVTFDHQPASKRAILILDNGSQIQLNDQRVGSLDIGHVRVENTVDSGLVYLQAENTTQYPDGQVPTNTIYTPRGGAYNFVLPDGTRVFLNSDSRITYPIQFGKTREIHIEGEAYLDVAHDAQHPFIVHTALQKLEVLGTSFNVNAYAGSRQHETTLVTGKLRAYSASLPSQQVTLTPGEFAKVNDRQQLAHGKANLSKIMAWKNGDFYFEDETLPEIMETLARWYDVKFNYAAISGLNERFAGVISRDKKLSAVLAMLESTGKVKFKITEKEVLLMN